MVDRLGEEYLELFATADPFAATLFGIPGHDAEVPDVSASARTELATRMASIRDLAAAVDPSRLPDVARASRALLVHNAQSMVTSVLAREADWALGGLAGPVYPVLASVGKAVLSDPAKCEDYALRCSRLGGYLDQSIANLRIGANDGYVANRSAVTSTIATLDGYLARGPAADPLLLPLTHVDDSRIRARVEAAVSDGVRPALARLRTMLDQELLPRARPDERCGIRHLPDGERLYRLLARGHTATGRTPEELHETGLQLAKGLAEEFAELGGKTLATADVEQVRRRLREDPTLRYESSEQILADARRMLARAEEALPDWFGRRHQAPCAVEPMNAAEAASAVLGYYQPPAADGSRPGRHWVNTSQPSLRPRYEYEALAVHESVPGHHLQFAVAQELDDLPEFRRFAYVTAYAEGWGLYSERLADEMGLYSTDLARFGMVSFDTWRAGRLVVDTGMHAFGWSRQQAITYMWENTALTMANIVNEVDRYISLPGQALAYMTGRLELDRLRALARQRLGAAFDIRAFHDVVLGAGSIPFTELAEVVDRWSTHG
jgi:uncharacterized protein (DUF885 family)